jgi:hypothetical protein
LLTSTLLRKPSYAKLADFGEGIEDAGIVFLPCCILEERAYKSDELNPLLTGISGSEITADSFSEHNVNE